MSFKKFIFTLIISGFTLSAFAQDIQFSQFYASTLYLNPAFTGSSELTRIGMNLRNQWPGLDQSLVAYSAYMDHYIRDKNSGVGLIINGSRGSLFNLYNTEIGLLYSYRLQIAETRFFHFGIQGSFVSRSANFENVILSNQLDIDRGIINGGGGVSLAEESNRSFLDYNAGMLYYDERFWFGASAHHLTQPRFSYLDDPSNRLAIRYSVHGGIKFNLSGGFINDYFNNTRQERSISFAFNYKQQGDFNQLDVGTEFYFEPIVLGLWYRGLPTKNGLPNNEAIIGLIGFSLVNGLDLGYSYDFTVSRLGWRNSGGAHEVSVRYYILRDNSKKVEKSVLPSFKY